MAVDQSKPGENFTSHDVIPVMLVNQLVDMMQSWWTSLDWTKIVGITGMIGPKGELIFGNRYIPSILLVIEYQ